MKILHVMDKLSVDGSKVHGPGRQIAYRFPYYDKDRYELRLCSLRGEDAGAEFLREQGIHTTCLGRSKLDLRAVFDLLSIIDDWQPDILHLHGYASWPIGRIAARLKGRKILIQEHFTDESVPVYQRAIDWLLGGVQDAALAVSDVVADFMRDTRHVRGTAISVIWNGIPIESLRRDSESRDRALLDELTLPESARVIGIVGRLAKMKGHRYFLEAAKGLAERHDNLYFVIVGEGPLRPELESLTRDLAIESQVRFAGHRTDIPRFHSIFDVAVIASIYGEGFPTVGIEALACSVPLVVTDLPTFAPFYHHDYNVLVTRAGDSAAIQQAVQQLLTNPGLGRKLLANAQELLDKCRTEQVALRYTDIYDAMAAIR